MGKSPKGRDEKKSTVLSAVDLWPGIVPSEAYDLGRRLKLYFGGGNRPQLDRIEFFADGKQAGSFLQSGSSFQHKARSFNWGKMPLALSLFFLDFLAAGLLKKPFSFRRIPQVKTLANEVYKNNGKLALLFSEKLTGGGSTERLKWVFHGENLHGNNDREQFVIVNTDYLPHDCVEAYWEKSKIVNRDDILSLNAQFRKAWEIPPPAELEFKIGEASPPPPEPEAKASEPSERPKPLDGATASLPPKGKPAPDPEAPAADPPFIRSKWIVNEFGQAFKVLLEQMRMEPKPAATPQSTKAPKADEATPTGQPESENQTGPLWQAPPPAPIDRRLYAVPPTNGYWPDEAVISELPDEDTTHPWTLKNAFEGILILGRTGSGKSTGSGVMFAESFLRAGFGGLVLTVKNGEAEHWRRLCAYCGREKDLVVVKRGGDWKLNILAYEAQHPGRGAGLSENFTHLCKNLLRISARHKGSASNEQVWETAGDQLLNATFDLFVLAGGGLSFDRLADFVAAAPTEKLPTTEADWLKIPVFGKVFITAKKAATTPENQRLLSRASGYWFKIYPSLNSRTRTSVTLGIYAMFDAFRGRDIPALISSETNITPERIMAEGKIVLLDLPIKEFQHTGLLVQSAWKYLFQIALERQHRANDFKKRPVFLWEDEGQHFASEHDTYFQATARSARVSRVILTQSLDSVYQEFGWNNRSAANNLFANLNTKVFHNNSHHETNRFASEQFGKEINTRYTVTHSPESPSGDFLDALRRSFDPPNRTSVAGAEQWEDVVRPEEFNHLRTGGPENDFLVDAYITWMGLKTDSERHFFLTTFEQNRNL